MLIVLFRYSNIIGDISATCRRHVVDFIAGMNILLFHLRQYRRHVGDMLPIYRWKSKCWFLKNVASMSPTCRRLVGDNFVSGTTSSQILLFILCGIVGDMTATCRRHVADNVVVVERHYNITAHKLWYASIIDIWFLSYTNVCLLSRVLCCVQPTVQRLIYSEWYMPGNTCMYWISLTLCNWIEKI